MPEMNLRVKIRGGKRTPLEVYVESLSINGKRIVLQDGFIISDAVMEGVIDNAIIRWINNAHPQKQLDNPNKID